MGITRFFVDAIGTALALGLGTPDDVLRHATPELLSKHLPRPIWSKLITACLAVPRTDARLVVDTIGMAAICEHIPGPVLWACLSELGQRALGKAVSTAATTSKAPAASASLLPGVAPMSTPAAAASATSVSATLSPTAPSSAPTVPGGATPISAGKPGEAPRGAGPGLASSSPSSPSSSPSASNSGAVDKPMANIASSPVPVPVAASPSSANPAPAAGATPRASTETPAPLGPPPRAQTAPVVAPGSSPRSTSNVATVGGNGRAPIAGASTRRNQSGGMSAAPPAPPPKSAPKADPIEVDVEEEQLIDWAQAEESSSPDEARKR